MAISDTHERIDSREPAHPDRIVGSLMTMSASQAADVTALAVSEQPAWAADAGTRADSLVAWARALEEHHDEMVSLVVREVGKPVTEARSEVQRGARILRYYAQMAFDEVGQSYPSQEGSRLEVERRPLGIVLLVTPWNFPVAIPLWKIAPALAFGNAVLFRPSKAASITGSRLAELAQESIPLGILNFTPTTTEDTSSLLHDPRIAGVSFTGSTNVGRHVVSAVASRGAGVQAEMGGQNASIVLDDADIELAAMTVALAAMSYAGQKCTATSRVIVMRDVADRFVSLLVDRVRATMVGDPEEPSTVVGPLISAKARADVHTSIVQALARGGRLLTGGHDVDRDGWFYRPTLLSAVSPDDAFAQEETFGPAASVHVVDSVEEAVHVANRSRYGLSGAVFGTDSARALTVARRLRVGLVRVNASTAGVDFYVPFGGDGASGYGPREQGRAAKEFFTTTRTVFVQATG